jgi:hypothetical protein
VAVTDSGVGFDPPTPEAGDESGWGLFIVDRLSHRWGVERGARTRVWFEMGARQTEGAGADEPRAQALPGHGPERPPGHETRVRRGPMSRLRLGAQTST